MDNRKYCEFFNINEKYFPCIDESALNEGVDWTQTYPHETFVKLLKFTENMLGGATKRSIWIHGGYGTGKSLCAYAVKKILEVPKEELCTYWDRFEPLRREKPLLGKLLGFKENGIVTAYRYASGSIMSPQQFFFAVQESVKEALLSQGIKYKGENTLKESVIGWLEHPEQKTFMNALLEKPKWKSLFSESNADEIIHKLRKSSSVFELMNHIFRLAAEEGVTALSLDADRLRIWLKDIIDVNKVKIVFVWDEFSDFFRQNRNSLGELQKVVSFCQEMPFYLVIVTHPISSLTINDDSWKVVQQRFDRIQIDMPDSVAFRLIADAIKVKDFAKDQWENFADHLESEVPNAISEVMKATKITDRETIKNILPLHPFAALVLKHIAEAFQSNQRSLFDFIKTVHDTDVKAFQWFIAEYGPMSDEPLLTVDMLWDFFYVKGRDNLTPSIRLILDTFPQQTMLTEREKRVLKAILIMQAIDQGLSGAIPALKPTDQSLSYAFEGIPGYDTSAKHIAKGLEQKGILISTPIGDGKKAYGAAVLAGDNARIEQAKNEIAKKSTTAELVKQGGLLPTALSLSPALKLRYAFAPETGAMQVVTSADFIRVMDDLRKREEPWKFCAVLALAKDEEEAQVFRVLIKKTIANEDYRKIIVIDALSSPLGPKSFKQYVEYAAMAHYYSGNNKQQAEHYERRAKSILDKDWREKIHDGLFFVYTFADQEGSPCNGADDVQARLQELVLNKFKYVLDFTKGLTEPQLKLTHAKQAARYGMGDREVAGLIKGCEKYVLGSVWNRERYWILPELQGTPIVAIKKAVDESIEKAFESCGQISIDEIYNTLLQNKYGFSPCNLSAFLTGFLLKEYNSDPYRCINAEGYSEAMTPDKLAEMIGNCIGKTHKVTYIVKMTPEEKAFYEATGTAWGISTKSCSSPSQVSDLLSNKIRELGYPVWCLEEVDTLGVYDVIKKYICLVQSNNSTVHTLAIEIGKIMMQKPMLAQDLKTLLTSDKCQEGMREYLKHFENGKLLELAAEIGAEPLLLTDIKKIFSIKHSALWESETGQEEIRKLITEYEVVKITNQLLNVSCSSRERAFREWREQLKFFCVSCDSLRLKRPALDRLLLLLLKVVNGEDILPEMMRELLAELSKHRAELQDILKSKLFIFDELYGTYLDGFTDVEKEDIQTSITSEMFTMSATASNQVVKQAAEAYRKNQIKTQLFNAWRNLTASKNPREWSIKFQTPILCLVEPSLFGNAKKAFATLNSSTQSDSDIKAAMEFLDGNPAFFEAIKDEGFRDKKFMESLIGNYVAVLPDIVKIRAALEELPVDVYDWYDSPLVKEKIYSMANAEYYAGGSDRAISMIDEMSDSELKQRLKELVQKDIDLGVKIIANGGK